MGTEERLIDDVFRKLNVLRDYICMVHQDDWDFGWQINQIGDAQIPLTRLKEGYTNDHNRETRQ